MEYNPTRREHAITWFAADESAAQCKEQVRFLRDPDELAKVHSLYRDDNLFDQEDVRLCAPSDEFYMVKINSQLGMSLRKTANFEKSNPSHTGSEKLFVTHPDDWAVLVMGNGDRWWRVERHIVDHMRDVYDSYQQKYSLDENLAMTGINVRASRADGLEWNHTANTRADLQGADQASILDCASLCKIELSLTFLLTIG
jgi:hypothetical protein